MMWLVFMAVPGQGKHTILELLFLEGAQVVVSHLSTRVVITPFQQPPLDLIIILRHKRVILAHEPYIIPLVPEMCHLSYMVPLMFS
jgi:hypothetical protein